ncbi:hypothetical protein JVT61DRAFT_10345 [Boletus reticuloceps]|uniref:Uncharacterized protein n=1 Tax=Boletus reticuloceps TaxID=495285 RepID=A0A8I2YX25_9AGAM|nr:hypothetical protein JVT61DRAFT_10345 [Boletus reticuloceps]
MISAERRPCGYKHRALLHLSSWRDPGQTSVPCQMSTLRDLLVLGAQGSREGQGAVLTEGNLPPPGCITWADEIYPTVLQKGVVAHVIENELVKLDHEKALGAQQCKVQRVINDLQNLHITWHDLMSRVNACKQHLGGKTHTLAFDPKEALEPREHLWIAIRADTFGDDDVSDEFVMRAPKALYLDNIPTKARSIWHLEEMARKYTVWLEAKQKRADMAPFKFEPDDPTEDSLAEDEAQEAMDANSDDQEVVDDEDECDAEGLDEEEPPPSDVMDNEVIESRMIYQRNLHVRCH